MDRDGSTTSDDFGTKLANNPGIWFVLIVGFFLVLFTVFYFTSEIIYYIFGISILPIPRDEKGNESQPTQSDVVQHPVNPERVLDDAISTEYIKILKQRRREKYLTFLSPYTKVIL
jgi:hypothetical protein